MGEIIRGHFGRKKNKQSQRRSIAGICQLHVSLLESDPLIWRRILVRSDATLGCLHRVVHAAMGWQGRLIHRFETVLGVVGDPDLDRSLDLRSMVQDERDVRLCDVIFNLGDSLLFEYGPGARWLHEVQYEEHLSEHRYRLPRCIGGERACPPDQVAGLTGYREVLDALGNRRHPKFLETQAQVTPGFHPAVFDRERANRRLRRLESC